MDLDKFPRQLRRLAPQLRPGLTAYDSEPEIAAPPLVVTGAAPAIRPPVAPARRSPPRTPLVVAGIVVLVVLAGVLWVALPHGSPPLNGSPNWPWWVFALQFGAAELFVMHVQIRREARTVSLSDIPLVAGLFMLTPGHLLIARLVGPMLVFALHRKQGRVEAGFQRCPATRRGVFRRRRFSRPGRVVAHRSA